MRPMRPIVMRGAGPLNSHKRAQLKKHSDARLRLDRQPLKNDAVQAARILLAVLDQLRLARHLRLLVRIRKLVQDQVQGLDRAQEDRDLAELLLDGGNEQDDGLTDNITITWVSLRILCTMGDGSADPLVHRLHDIVHLLLLQLVLDRTTVLVTTAATWHDKNRQSARRQAFPSVKTCNLNVNNMD